MGLSKTVARTEFHLVGIWQGPLTTLDCHHGIGTLLLTVNIYIYIYIGCGVKHRDVLRTAIYVDMLLTRLWQTCGGQFSEYLSYSDALKRAA